MTKKIITPNLLKENIPIDDYDIAISMVDIHSQEGYIENDEFIPYLKGVNIVVPKGKVYTVTGDSEIELKLTLQIMANLRPYSQGRLVLAEKGSMKIKKLISNHLFYFDKTNILFNNMTVLEYLVFMFSVKYPNDLIQLQKELLDELIVYDLGHISLTNISALTAEEKTIVHLLVAKLTRSNIIVADLNGLNFADEETVVIKHIVEKTKSEGITLVISTKDPLILTMIGDKKIIINNGISYESNITIDEAILSKKNTMSVLLNALRRIIHEKENY